MNFLKRLFKKKKKKTLHKNKYSVGDICKWKNKNVSICDYINETDTTNYIIFDLDNKKDIYQWINETELY